MAQYSALNQQQTANQAQQSDITNVQNFYQPIEDGQNIQYVIAAPEPGVAYQAAQQVVDQLVLVDGQQGQVIIDQSTVNYQQPSYILQKSPAVDFGVNKQVYYMTNNGGQGQQILLEHSPPQQVIINQNLMQGHLQKLMNSPLPQVQQPKFNRMPFQRSLLESKIKRPAVITQTLESTFANESEDIEDKILAINRQTTGPDVKKTALQPRLSQGAGDKQPKPAPKQRTPAPKLSQTITPPTYSYRAQQPPAQKQSPQTYSMESSRPKTNETNQFLIQPPRPKMKKLGNVPLPHFLHSTQIKNILENTPKSEEYSNSIRMLISLENGEQRLITFTLPKEACRIQEILEQVQVPFDDQTEIKVIQADYDELDYIVYVGNVASSAKTNTNDQQQESQERELSVAMSDESVTDNASCLKATGPPKYVQGYLAVCSYCGYLSEDFSKCLRCHRNLPADVKSMSNANLVAKAKMNEEKGIGYQKTNGVPKMNLLQRKRPSKSKITECETVVVSSDEEGEENDSRETDSSNASIMDKLGNSISLTPISKEPSPDDIVKQCEVLAHRETVPDHQVVNMLVTCRTCRIGSYRFVPPEPIRIDSNRITIKVPHPKFENVQKILKIDNSNTIKVLVSWHKSLPVIFFYLAPLVGTKIRAALDMNDAADLYFDPISETDESHRRITLLPEVLSDDSKAVLSNIYCKNFVLLDELTYKEANELLIKTCPKDVARGGAKFGGGAGGGVKQLLSYPPEGRGRITINTEDYICLGSDQFLNDVIIDFYLKYVITNLPKVQQERVHLFSTFFYKRLTMKPVKASRKSQPNELDPNLSPAEKRHSRVKTWTKNVNIFDKEFIIIPINENCHWFLAIICYPSMDGCRTFEGNQAIRIEPKSPRKKVVRKTVEVASPAINVVPHKRSEQSIMCDGDLSDKDEAEGDDSELDSDDSEVPETNVVSVENNSDRPAIKQPCILIFDSLAGASRSRVVATLRDYLTCEYKAKLNSEKVYTKDIIKGACPKVPQQTNFTDCGLYLLQYVEQFFKDPIKDYYIPIPNLKQWFDELTVTKKREDISLLIKALMKESGKDLSMVPDVVFPTLNGEIVEMGQENDDQFVDPDEDQELMEEEDEDYVPPHMLKKQQESVNVLPLKPSSDSTSKKSDFIKEALSQTLLKPDSSEMKQRDEERLAILKAKRIQRHKTSNVTDEPDSKKIKSDKSFN